MVKYYKFSTQALILLENHKTVSNLSPQPKAMMRSPIELLQLQFDHAAPLQICPPDTVQYSQYILPDVLGWVVHQLSQCLDTFQVIELSSWCWVQACYKAQVEGKYEAGKFSRKFSAWKMIYSVLWE